MPTINDVAKAAGVSRSTVSLVINKSPLVKDSTRELVENVIRQMNYVPNSNARGLSAQVTNNIGIIFMQEMMPGSVDVSYDNDQHIGLCSYNISNGVMAGLQGTYYGVITEKFCSIAQPDMLPNIIREKRVDGVVVVGTPRSQRFLQNLKKSGIPFVLAGIDNVNAEVDSVYTDPGEGTEIAVRHLLSTGHKRVCLLNCAKVFYGYEGRLRGYQRALEAFDIPFDPSWNVISEQNNGKYAKEAFRRFWEAGNRPDGVVAANGQSAAGVLSYLYDIGVKVPRDISVIAYEDSSVCGYATPALTSVNIRKEEIGLNAVRRLMSLIQNPDQEVQIELMHPYMVYRDSVKGRNDDD